MVAVHNKALGLGLLLVAVSAGQLALADHDEGFGLDHDILDNNNNGIDDIKELYDTNSGHEVVGNAPYGSYVLEPDTSCPNSGVRFNRMFYGSTIALNSVSASDPGRDVCDDTSEGGPGQPGEDLVGALVNYYWTTYPAGHPDEGLRCDDQGLGSMPLMSPIADPDDTCLTHDPPCSSPSMLSELYICKITVDWDGYEHVMYKTGDECNSLTEDCSTRAKKGHPTTHTNKFVRAANVKRNNWGFLTGISPLRTWGCDWMHVAKSYCYEPNSDIISSTECNSECFIEHGCGYDANDAGDMKQLQLQEMVVEIELDPTDTHPPDVYFYKPQIDTPDGFPAPSALGSPPHPASDWLTADEIELRFNNYLAHFPISLKTTLLGVDMFHADILTALSTDNFGSQDLTHEYNMYVLFDDNAGEGIWNVHDWESGAYCPEDRLDTFRMRGNSGGGTWALVTVDDCADPSQGMGASVVTWQIHFVCVDVGPCVQSAPPCSGTGCGGGGAQNRDSGSGSGDPHMVGFRGQKFDYHGLPGEFFNVLSTTHTQLNAFLQPELLDGLTYMGSLGLQTNGGGKVQISAIPGSQTLLVELNDQAIDTDSERGDVAVSFVDPLTVKVTTPEIVLVAGLHKEEFVDVKAVELRARPERIHGVLGNTVNLDAGTDMVGEDADYFVSHMWATDFKHNVFATQQKYGGIRSFAKKLSPILQSTAEAPFQAGKVIAAKMINFRK